MRNYEEQVFDAIGSDQQVHYSVTPTYRGSRTVPTGFMINAVGRNPDGSIGLTITNRWVPNSLINGRNLGLVNDPKTGQPVPTGGMN